MPVQFTAWEPLGSSTERCTEGRAAKWKTASQPRTALSQAARSRTSPFSRSTCLATGWRLARVPVTRLSRTRTSQPRASAASTRWEPMNPAPPVTRILTARDYSGLPPVGLLLH